MIPGITGLIFITTVNYIIMSMLMLIIKPVFIFFAGGREDSQRSGLLA